LSARTVPTPSRYTGTSSVRGVAASTGTVALAGIWKRPVRDGCRVSNALQPT
jgi:hypothetical protein